MAERQLTASKAVEIKIIEARPDGSGIVELPIVSEEQEIDLSKTAGGQDRTDKITAEDLRSAVENFAEWPGPVPVHRSPHRTKEEASGPAEGFIEKLFVRGKQLWARMDLTANLFYELTNRMWRAFSVDYGRGASLPTKKLKGFLVARGVFTNQPASDVHFRVSAETGPALIDGATAMVSLIEGGSKMGQDEITVRLAAAEAEAANAKQQFASLTSQLAEKKTAYDKLAGELQEARAELETVKLSAEKRVQDAMAEGRSHKLSLERLEGEIKDLNGKLNQAEGRAKEFRQRVEDLEKEAVSSKVLSLCRAAVKDGVPPAEIKKIGDYEQDPVGWLQNNFKTIETAEMFLKALPREASMSRVRSGHSPATGADGDLGLTPQQITELKRRGLDPKYVRVTNSNDLGGWSGKKATESK